MHCPKCGRPVEQEGVTCRCGASLEEWQKGAYNEAAAEESWKESIEKTPLKWYKFLINFSLFVGALMFLSNARMSIEGIIFTGMEDSHLAPELLAEFPKLKVAGMILCAAYVALAVFAVITRFKLAQFRENGPEC